MKQTKILLAGEGGQGIQTIAKVLSDAAAKSGLQVSYIPSFGVEQRGTPSLGFLILAKDKIFYPRFETADYIVALQHRAIPFLRKYVAVETKFIFDSSTIARKEIPKNAMHVLGIPATKYAAEKFTQRAFNVLIAGKLSQVLNIPGKTVWESIEKVLGKKFKNEQIRKANEDAFLFGREAVFEVDSFTKPTFMPSKERIILKGFGKHGEILPERCKGCGICIEKCPVRALKFSDTLGVFATPVPESDLEKCIACGNCRRFCPDSAINIEKDK